MVLTVFVPVTQTDLAATEPDLARILPGSAIVGRDRPDANWHVLVYFQGGLYAQTGMDQFETRVMFAAERLVQRAPTVARMVVHRTTLEAVASYDTATRRIDVARPESLRSWTEQWRPR